MAPDRPTEDKEMTRRTYLELAGLGIGASRLGGVGLTQKETAEDRRGFGRVRYGDIGFGNETLQPPNRNSTDK